MIPKYIYQTHVKKTNKLEILTKTWQYKNYEYEYYFYNDNDMYKWFRCYDQKAFDAYNSVNAGAIKADLWRYCILYETGGIYVDADMACLDPLKTYVNSEDNGIVVYDGIKKCNNIFQGFLAFEKNSDVMKDAMELCIDNILNKRFESTNTQPHDVFNISGPKMFGNIVKNYESSLKFLYHQPVLNHDYIIHKNNKVIKCQCLGHTYTFENSLHYKFIKNIYKY